MTVNPPQGSALATQIEQNPNPTGSMFPWPRQYMTAGVAIASGALHAAIFTAQVSRKVSNIATACFSTAAGATPTLCRMGLWAVTYNIGAGTFTATLVGSTPNDTTLWAATTTEYPKAMSAPVTLTAGALYAVGALCVTAAAAPVMYHGTQLGAVFLAPHPFASVTITGLADLPASFTQATAGLVSGPAPIYSRLS